MNTEFKGTPGPWGVIKNHSVIGIAEGCEKLIVYAPFQHPGCMQDWTANAALIASAPEMLEALQSILSLGRKDLSNPKYDSYFENAQSIITKALNP